MKKKRAAVVSDATFKVARPRSRSMGSFTTRDFTYAGGTTYPTATYSGTIPGQDASGFVKTMNDVVTPGYSSLIDRGVRVNNPYSSLTVTRKPYLAVNYLRGFSPQGWERVSGPTVARVFGSLYSNLPSNPINKTLLNQQATLQAWAGVEPAKSQTLVTVLEAHKTWETIYNRAVKLAKIVEACRRKDVRALQRMLPGARRTHTSSVMVWDDDGRPLLSRRGNLRYYRKAYSFSNNRKYRDEASQLWLEYRYGISPIVYDMVDTLKAVYEADLRHELLPKDVYVSRGKREASQTVTTPLDVTSGGLRYTGNRTTEFKYVVRTYIHYRWSAPDGILRRLNDFGLFDVPRAIWEVCPFSFIADWFIPIGDWLGALTPKIGVENLDMGFTQREEIHASQTVSGFPQPVVGGTTYTPVCPLGSSDLVDVVSMSRDTFLGIPYYPPTDIQLNIKRMVDVAALFRGMR